MTDSPKTEKALASVGERVRLLHNVDRYPHFIAPEGAVGTVVSSDQEVFAVRLDEHLKGAETWANEVCWYPTNGDDPSQDIEAID